MQGTKVTNQLLYPLANQAFKTKLKLFQQQARLSKV